MEHRSLTQNKVQKDWNEFLKEYEEKELERIKKAQKRRDLASYYRGRLGGRLTMIAEYGCSIYPQIPFGDPLIVVLHPYPPNKFEKICGFELSQVEKLLSFAKETGRLQFVLHGYPSHFHELNFLEPIFRELKPPIWVADMDRIMPFEQYKECIIEFDTWVKNFKFRENYISSALKQGFSENFALRSLYDTLGFTYCVLKYFGYKDIIEHIENQFLGIAESLSSFEKGKHAQAILNTLIFCNKLIVEPLGFPLEHDRIYSLEFLNLLNSAVPNVSASLQPITGHKYYEVAEFLFEKLPKKNVPFPENIEACREVIYRYEAEDLYGALKALSSVIRKKESEEIVHKTQDVEEILDNVWKDVNKVKTQRLAAKAGIVAFTSSLSLVGGFVGFVSNIIFQAFSELLDIGNRVSKSLVRIFNPHMSLLFDFKQKYKIN